MCRKSKSIRSVQFFGTRKRIGKFKKLKSMTPLKKCKETKIGKIRSYYGGFWVSVNKVDKGLGYLGEYGCTYRMHIEDMNGLGKGEEISEVLYNELIRHNIK